MLFLTHMSHGYHMCQKHNIIIMHIFSRKCVIGIFTASFDSNIASLWNKSINFFLKIQINLQFHDFNQQ